MYRIDFMNRICQYISFVFIIKGIKTIKIQRMDYSIIVKHSCTTIPPNIAIVNSVSFITYRPLLEDDVFAILFMNHIFNLTSVAIGKLGKLKKQTKLFSRLFFIV